MHTAKIVTEGVYQTVKLPKDFVPGAHEVIIHRLGDGILLQPVKKTWLDIYQDIKPISDFMDEREDDFPEDKEVF